MCFTRRKIKQKKYKKKNKVYPDLSREDVREMTMTTFIKECICCQNCKQIFNLGSNQIKIHCAGCQKFFHCGIAGKCVGPNCTGTTINGEKHSLSWCAQCVPLIEGNEVKKDGIGTCMCGECLETISK